MRSLGLGVALAAGSALAWGAWGYLSARAGHSSGAVALWLGVVLIEGLVALPTIAVVRPYFGLLAVAAGVVGVGGYLLYFLALRVAPLASAAPLVAVTALYPVVTLAIGLIVDGRAPSWRQLLGMLLAVVAVALIAG